MAVIVCGHVQRDQLDLQSISEPTVCTRPQAEGPHSQDQTTLSTVLHVSSGHLVVDITM